MRDSLELFEKTLEDYASCKHIQNNLMDLVESLYKDLEDERLTTATLQKQIQDFSNEDVFGVTSKFAALKGEYAALKNKLITLRNENDDLNFQLIARSQESKKNLTEKEDELKTYFESKLREKDEEISKKEKEFETNRIMLKQKEQEFYNELQLTQASTALELDKVESDFRKQLNESNKKLKDSIDTCNILRIELMSVKEQFAEYKKTSNAKISELQKRIKEVSTCDSSRELREDVTWNNDVDISTSTSDKSNKYKPLDVSCKNIFSSEERPINLKKAPVYRGSGKFGGTSNYRSNTLPPLIQVKKNNAAKESNAVNKKRKLFNPEDLTYLSLDLDKEY